MFHLPIPNPTQDGAMRNNEGSEHPMVCLINCRCSRKYIIFVLALALPVFWQIVLSIQVSTQYKNTSILSKKPYQPIVEQGQAREQTTVGVTAIDQGPKHCRSLPNCTNHILNQISRQLPSERCDSKDPWAHQCSITKATACMDATWLTDYYSNLHKAANRTGYPGSFLGISVGCNKGLDALDTLRMGTQDRIFDKSAWWDVLNDNENINPPYCKQERNLTSQIPIATSVESIQRKGEMHCIEALPGNFNILKHTAEQLGIDKKGFTVRHAAISKNDGSALFPSGNNSIPGIENMGLANCISRRKDVLESCVEVDGFTLSHYVDKFVQSQGPINVLSVDVEGFDFDVLIGSKNILDRVEYLSFEYNWMGSWAKQNLNDAIQMLDRRGFTCYWAGEDTLWRISGCWQEYYGFKFWANVACVHRSQCHLADIMEKVFQKTLQLDQVWAH